MGGLMKKLNLVRNWLGVVDVNFYASIRVSLSMTISFSWMPKEKKKIINKEQVQKLGL